MKKKLLIGIALIILIFLFFVSTILRNYAINNSQELIGRKIALKELHINYLKLQVAANDFVLYEKNEVDTFVYFSEFVINFNPWPLFKKEYAIDNLSLINPRVVITKENDIYNFTDITKLSEPDSLETKEDADSENLKFSIKDIKVKNGYFKFYDKIVNSRLGVDNLDLSLPLIAWDDAQSNAGVGFNIGEKGRVKIQAESNRKTETYSINIITKDIELNNFVDYAKEYLNVSKLKALLQSDILIKGSTKDFEDIVINGYVEANNVAIIDNKDNELLNAKKVSTYINSLDIKKMNYTINKIKIDSANVFTFINSKDINWEYFFQPMLLTDSTVTNNADSLFVKDTTVNQEIFFRVDTTLITQSRVRFIDSTFTNPFVTDLININIDLYKITSDNDNMPHFFGSECNIINKKDTAIIKTNGKLISLQDEYDINVKVNNFNTDTFKIYLTDYLNIGKLQSLINADVNIKGKLSAAEKLILSGKINVDSVDIEDDRNLKLYSSSNMSAEMENINYSKSLYSFKNISVKSPKIYAYLNKNSNNWSYFLEPTLNDTISVDTENENKDLQNSESIKYSISKFSINDGVLIFADSTLNRLFNYSIRDINATTYELASSSESVKTKFECNLNNDGDVKGNVLFNVNNPHYLKLDGKISHLELYSFSPYSEYYLGYPISSGSLSYDCKIDMVPNKLKNSNKISLQKPKLGEKTKDSTAYSLPLKLAINVLSNPKGDVNIDLPVSGNPSSPDFKLGRFIMRTLTKFVIKTAASPFNILAKMVGGSAEQIEFIPLSYASDSLSKKDYNSLDKIAELINKKKSLCFVFRQEFNKNKALKVIADKIIKQRYIKENNISNKFNWSKINDKDSLFVNYVNQLCLQTDSSLVVDSISFNDKIKKIIPLPELEKELVANVKSRNDKLYNYMINTKKCPVNNIKITNYDAKNMSNNISEIGFRVSVTVK